VLRDARAVRQADEIPTPVMLHELDHGGGIACDARERCIDAREVGECVRAGAVNFGTALPRKSLTKWMLAGPLVVCDKSAY
jgi:hypothetical protein